jgi:ABC-type nitrate/sulfonate/bicarbonate transport system substrate-binding protein
MRFPVLERKATFMALDDNLAALEKGDVDVGIFFETAQVPLLISRGHGVNVLRYSDIGFDVYSHVLFVRKDFFYRNQTKLKKLATILQAMTRKVFRDPKASANFFAEKIVRYSDFKEAAFAHDAEYRQYLETCCKISYYYTSKGVGDQYGVMSRYRWQAMINTLKDMRLINNSLDAKAVYSNELFAAAPNMHGN